MKNIVLVIIKLIFNIFNIVIFYLSHQQYVYKNNFEHHLIKVYKENHENLKF